MRSHGNQSKNIGPVATMRVAQAFLSALHKGKEANRDRGDLFVR
jgi:hypothetical protein